jgi:geranylgeranyl diphosphate synthase, type II
MLPTTLSEGVKDYQHLLDLFSARLAAYNHELAGKTPPELYEPEAYILSLGGKRLRPLLALMACDLLECDPALALDAALSVELFHNFSLIHDDILDDAPLRRNQPTVHARWNTNIAILSGDIMLVNAFQALGQYDDKRFRQLSELLQHTAAKVCEGQQMDMNFENLAQVSVAEYLLMIEYKTAALLGCSLQMGAICAGAAPGTQQDLYGFGKHLGIAFQLNDDLLDAYADKNQGFGKQTGGDIMANKKTYLLTKTLELAGEKQTTEIRRLLDSDKKEEKIPGMLRIFDELNIKELCLAEAGRHTTYAVSCLDKLEANAGKKEKLKKFAHELLGRQI